MVLGVIVLVAAFAWYGVGAEWNPGARASSLKVAIVNEDEGVSASDAQAKVASAGVDVAAIIDKQAAGQDAGSKDGPSTADSQPAEPTTGAQADGEAAEAPPADATPEGEGAQDGAPGEGTPQGEAEGAEPANGAVSENGEAAENPPENEGLPEASAGDESSQPAQAAAEGASESAPAEGEPEGADNPQGANSERAGESPEGEQPENAEAAASAVAPTDGAEAPNGETAAAPEGGTPDAKGPAEPSAANAGKKADMLNMGAVIVGAAKENADFDWQFMGSDEAHQGMASGELYAEFRIPEGFTAEFLAVLAGELDRPTVEFWVSEERGIVSVDADDLVPGSAGEAVSQAFSVLASDTFSALLGDASQGKAAKDVAVVSTHETGLDGAEQDLKTVEANLNQTKESTGNWKKAVESAGSALDNLKTTAPNLRNALKDAQDRLADVRTTSHEVSSAYGSALAKGDQGLSEILSGASDRMGSAAESVSESQKAIDSELEKTKKAIDECSKLIAALKKADPKSSTVADLEKQNDKLKDQLDNLQKASKALADAADKAKGASDDLSKDASKALNDLKNRADTFNEVTLPKLDTSLDALAIVMGMLDGVLGGLDAQISQMKNLFDNLQDVLQKTEDATVASSDELAVVGADLATARSDISALANAKAVQDAVVAVGSSPQSYRTLVASPITSEAQDVYAPASLGAGMAPGYAALALLVGCLALVAMVRPEVDPELFPRRRAWQAYVGRLMTLSLLAALLGVVLTAGLVVMGVQAASPAAFIVAGVVAALCDMGVVYAIVKLFKHIGKPIAALFVALQVPVAMGSFPIQLLPDLVRGVVPWLPVTYGMEAMREAASGLYGLTYAVDVLWLAACGLVALAVALFVGPRLRGMNSLFRRKLASGGLFVAADREIEVEEDENSPLARAVRRLLEDEDERTLLHARSQRFAQRYVAMQYVAPLAAFVFVAALVVVSFALPLNANEKLVALAALVAALVVVFGVCLVFERACENMSLQLEGVNAGGIRVTSPDADASSVTQRLSVAPLPVAQQPADEQEDMFVDLAGDDWDAGESWSKNSAFNWSLDDEDEFATDEPDEASGEEGASDEVSDEEDTCDKASGEEDAPGETNGEEGASDEGDAPGDQDVDEAGDPEEEDADA